VLFVEAGCTPETVTGYDDDGRWKRRRKEEVVT
jgi:hypothetical protein